MVTMQILCKNGCPAIDTSAPSPLIGHSDPHRDVGHTCVGGLWSFATLLSARLQCCKYENKKSRETKVERIGEKEIESVRVWVSKSQGDKQTESSETEALIWELFHVFCVILWIISKVYGTTLQTEVLTVS